MNDVQYSVYILYEMWKSAGSSAWIDTNDVDFTSLVCVGSLGRVHGVALDHSPTLFRQTLYTIFIYCKESTHNLIAFIVKLIFSV